MFGVLARAQKLTVQPVQRQQIAAGGAVNVRLGQSVVPLNGPWKFTVGDSPLDAKTGQPLWAEPGFDDSSWETVDLTPKVGAVDPLSGESSYVPGWAVRGHPGYWGYAWYRIRVHVEAQAGQKLALAGPANIDDVYQVFANGGLVGHFGSFKNNPPTTYYTQPMMFLLPGQGDSGAESGNGAVSDEASTDGSRTQVLAYRVYMLPSTLTEAADVGGFHMAPVLGDASTVSASYQMIWLELVRGYALRAAMVPMFGVMAVLAFTLILFDRSDPVYLWIGALFVLETAGSGLSILASWTQWVSILQSQVFNDALLNALSFAGWVMVWWVWFGRQRPAWTPRAAACLAALFVVTIILGQEMFAGLIPHQMAAAFLTASVLVRLLFLALQLWIVFQGIRGNGLEGWMVLPAVVLWGISTFTAELAVLHIPIRWSLFGLSIRLGQVSDMLLTLVVATLLLRRLLKSIQNQRQMALDVKQAQEVQQVILPEAITRHGGLVIESEYHPAREVGGDFYQIIPNEKDGSLLIVAGDVAGKGLQAGMLVALLVGAIRTAASFTTDPGFLLDQLNQRLLGRSNGQATCLALKIAPDGAVTLANAGHLPPYLNGEPLPMEGALPLGMKTGAEFSILRFQLKVGDKLMLLSDGVAEATDANGHLFGFERVRELLHTARNASEVAIAAQSFGQADDISIIAVSRNAVREPAAA
ncbi:MAG: SpoIIE family protein phosphatase [Terracidiphilus sp.]